VKQPGNALKVSTSWAFGIEKKAETDKVQERLDKNVKIKSK